MIPRMNGTPVPAFEGKFASHAELFGFAVVSSPTLTYYQDRETVTFVRMSIRDPDSVLVSANIIRLFRKVLTGKRISLVSVEDSRLPNIETLS